MKNTSKKLYVAYGSNLDLGQMKHRCPDATVYGSGKIQNYELTFWGNWRRNGVATIVPHQKFFVPVGVFKISATDEENLDIYEGWPHLYRKENIQVKMDDGETVTAMIYLMNKNGMVESSPSPGYFHTISIGYSDFGFDLDVLEFAAEKVARHTDKYYNYRYGFSKI
ncbi:MAG: gamma-glutamylcyclotransferase [Lachnospiraceae bacterium]|nr:gamma-glutamylcyclotransferase [Lachnospiraceae bacterium]